MIKVSTSAPSQRSKKQPSQGNFNFIIYGSSFNTACKCCSEDHRKCVYSSSNENCDRCVEMGRPCEKVKARKRGRAKDDEDEEATSLFCESPPKKKQCTRQKAQSNKTSITSPIKTAPSTQQENFEPKTASPLLLPIQHDQHHHHTMLYQQLQQPLFVPYFPQQTNVCLHQQQEQQPRLPSINELFHSCSASL